MQQCRVYHFKFLDDRIACGQCKVFLAQGVDCPPHPPTLVVSDLPLARYQRQNWLIIAKCQWTPCPFCPRPGASRFDPAVKCGQMIFGTRDTQFERSSPPRANPDLCDGSGRPLSRRCPV